MKVLSRVIWGFRRENRKINGQYITISPPPLSRFKIPTEPLLPLIKTLFCLPLNSPMTPGLILLSSKLGDVAKLQSFSSKDSDQNIQISDLFSLFCSFDVAVCSVLLFFLISTRILITESANQARKNCTYAFFVDFFLNTR